MKSFGEFLTERLEDPEFRREYEALRPEFEATKAQLRAELADKKTESQKIFPQYDLSA